MPRRPARNVATVLNAPHDTRLSALVREAQRLQKLQQCLREQLHPALGEQLQLMRADPGEVVVEVATSAWATRLRYQSRMIIALLHREVGLATRRVTIRVARDVSTPPVVKPSRPGISASVARTLRQTAAAVDDPALAQALKRLASHTRSQS